MLKKMSQILNLADYSNKSIVVRGKDTNATRSRKEELKKLGGIYNPRLRTDNENISPGWIFPTKDKDKIQNYINNVNFSSTEKEKQASHTNDNKKMKHKTRFIDTFEPQLSKKRRISNDKENPYLYVFCIFIIYLIFTTTTFVFLTASARTRIISSDSLPSFYSSTLFGFHVDTENIQNLTGHLGGYLTWIFNISSNIL